MRGLLPNELSMHLAAGNHVGWNETNKNPADRNSTLSSVSGDIKAAHPHDINKQAHAIPSPIAYIKKFFTDLSNKEQYALDEWRGMLAAIALRKFYGLDITVKAIPLFFDQNNGSQPTAFGSIVGETLCEDDSITGFKTAGYKYLVCFCVNDKPFAMHIPGMVICPFKEYVHDIFNSVPWYDKTKKVFTPILEQGSIYDQANGITDTGRKLYLWLDNINATHNGLPGNSSGFIGDFLAYLSPNRILPDAVPAYQMDPDITTSVTFGCLWPDLCSFCSLPKEFPSYAFSDKMLFVIPNAGHYSGLVDVKGERRDYSINKPNRFTPWEFKFNNNTCYAVPPISRETIEKICEHGLTVSNVNCIKDEEAGGYVYSFTLIHSGGTPMVYTKLFTPNDIVWTTTLPYLSLWPAVNFANDSWKKNYVAIWPVNDFEATPAVSSAAEITENPKTTKVGGYNQNGDHSIPYIDIDVVTNNSNQNNPAPQSVRYDCHAAYRDKSFTMLMSESRAEALSFNATIMGKPYSLGCWEIVRDGFVNANLTGGAATYRIGLDFGTTSTNVYIKNSVDANIARSVKSPGEYTYEIFNPYIRSGNNDSLITDFFQNYHLFSVKKGEMGKIFTYGINFDVKQNGNLFATIIPFVSGKFLMIDEDYFIAPNEGFTDIWDMLKWATVGGNDRRVIAGENFISSLLTVAVLQAKLEGASVIELEISYPSEKNKGLALAALNSFNSFIGLNAMGISEGGITEAKSAGLYFSKLYNGVPPVNAFNGFMIVDIGGGTTDVSYWKSNAPGADPDCLAEDSIKFAGVNLVQKSIMQKVQDAVFVNLWQNPSDAQRKAIDTYTSMPLPVPIPFNNEEAKLKMSKLSFLLEKAELNQGNIARNEQDLIAVMRLKYLALFACIAKRVSNLDFNPFGISIFMAGCGSKGMDVCRFGDTITRFDDLAQKVFSGTILEKSQRNIAAQTHRSGRNNKEEVVLGLTVFPHGANGAAFVPAAAAVADANPAVALDQAKLAELMEQFDKFIDTAAAADETYKQYHEAYKLSVNGAFTQLSQSFVGYAPAIWVEVEGDEDLFLLRMLDEMINLNN